ncbi:autotransporter outer membrane beta-barrel domain-containing protein [Marilutibacter alkalisoli]|uniref:Autotransporter outer membrane beta-barrel domain-containing protein n=1 Tax=Marilutibacter alkalisoli TaxID=2591633 RepID=A0A514BV44_9GAMM|nr:autotransporter outer membrane beta-barrel domain-containing protein [Lysobacter alkalisoli]QDH71237.1 autotransporter outer membrane beta-barrel domain-containing protein [Lysobacter alkalisoli]
MENKMSCPYRAARGSEKRVQLPLLWQQSMIDNARIEAERTDARRRLKALSFSIAAALTTGLFARTGAVQAETIHTDPITGVDEHDRAGGSGNYDPGYDIVDEDGTLHYRFVDGDSVTLEGVDTDVLAMSIASGNPPVVLDVASGGWLELSAIRGESSTVGSAVGILNDGNTVTVNGNTRISTNADDLDFGMVRGNGAQGVIGRGRSTTTFNGATDIHARTQGHARAVWADRTSTIIFNGPTTILAESRGTLDAVYSFDGRITFNGDTTISALSIWPSDNAHAIYNDGVGSRMTVNGDLSLTTVAMGSTAFGVRNQGTLEVNGDTTVNVQGPRSTHGIASWHWRSRMTFNGDVDVHVRSEGPENGYTPFGKPSGLKNDRSPGAVMTFNGAVNVDVTSEADTYGTVNSGVIEFTSPTAPVSFTVAAACDPPDIPNCDRDVYGIRNFGTVNVAGGLTVSTTAAGTGAAYSIWSVPIDVQDASVTVNQAGGQRVQLDGDIATATETVNGNIGSVDINFDTSDSWLRGLVGGVQVDTSYSVGRADLVFANGAAWMPQGTGTLANDFGTGTLSLGSGAAIDMAGYWGRFAPGEVPAHDYRQLVVDSSNGDTGAGVVLGDDARFLLLSDITGISGTATADRIVFGSGITSFSATGTQGVGIVYDPALDDTSWVNATTVRTGTTIQAAAPIDIVDASAAAGGTATFSAVTGVPGEWSGTYENALVRYTYTPQVALSADGSRIVLSGIAIQGTEDGSGDGDGSSGGGDDSGGSGDDTGGGDAGGGTGEGSGDGADDTGGTGGGTPALTPSETVQTAADVADSVLNLWRTSGQRPLQRVRGQLRGKGVDRAGAWAVADSGGLTADTAYSRRYRQDYGSVTVGADRGFASSNVTGFSAGHVRATARYAQGRGELSGTTVGLYSGWIGEMGGYVVVGAETASLKNRYSARDSQGRDITGEYRARANRAYVEGGYPFRFHGSWYIEPQLELSAGAIGRNDHTTSNGVHVRQERLDASFARAGLALGRTLQGAKTQGSVYARASALHHFGDPLEITASRDGGSIVPDTLDREGSGSEFVLGGNVSLSRTGLFFEASKASGVDLERDWAVQAGLRYRW